MASALFVVKARFSFLLPSGGGDALDEGFLGEEEEDDEGEDYQGGGGHEVVPFGAALTGLEGLEA